jgi:Zn-dependent peptidase ImmA (M78 family)
MSKRAAMPGTRLPYLTDRAFEEEASLLLAEYGRQHGEVATPPVPIDEIVELHLGLQLELYDMRRLFGVDDVHGALWVNQRRVGIDRRLEPAANPAMLGRFRFTLAHEAGHWRLHRQLFKRAANQLQLLPESCERPEYICRSSDSEPIEYQANRFASSVLMPQDLLRRCWEEWRGNSDPIYLDDLRAKQQQILTAEVLRRGGFKSGDGAIDNMLIEHAARPLAMKFEVSPQAMRIRLEGIGLLVRKKERLLF